jgi:hypothetical protein
MPSSSQAKRAFDKTMTNSLGAKAIMPPCARSLLNGSVSSLLVGNSVPLMFLNAICRPFNFVAHLLPALVNNSNKNI